MRILDRDQGEIVRGQPTTNLLEPNVSRRTKGFVHRSVKDLGQASGKTRAFFKFEHVYTPSSDGSGVPGIGG